MSLFNKLGQSLGMFQSVGWSVAFTHVLINASMVPTIFSSEIKGREGT
jgi:hypothetical protein